MYATLMDLSDSEWREQSAGLPSDYAGYWPGREGYLRVGIGQSRDSDSLEQSNYVAAHNLLTDAAKDLPERDTEYVLTHNASHWAVGWVDSLWIADVPELRKVVRDMWARLDRYPVLDEDDYSEREYEAWQDTVNLAIGDALSDMARGSHRTGWDSEKNLPIRDTFDPVKAPDDTANLVKFVSEEMSGGDTDADSVDFDDVFALVREYLTCECGRPYLDDPASGDGHGHAIDCPASRSQ